MLRAGVSASARTPQSASLPRRRRPRARPARSCTCRAAAPDGAVPAEPGRAADAAAPDAQSAAAAQTAAPGALEADSAAPAALAPPPPSLRWSAAVDAAVAADVLTFSAAAAAGLPLWSPAGLAVALVALVAACERRTLRQSAFEELSALLAARPTVVDEQALAVAAENLEQLKERQRAEAKRQAEEAAQEAARAEEDRRALEAEQARLQAEQAAAKAERDARQRVLDAERLAREEAAAAVRRVAERQAQAEAAARAAADAARRAAEEAERRRAEEEQRRLVEEDRRRRGIKTVIARFKGEVAVSATSRTLYEATVGLRVVGAATAETVEKRELHSAEELRAAVRDICWAAARSIVDVYGGDARSRSLLGAGPLTVLDDSELDHWLRLLRVRVAAAAEAALWRLTAEVEVSIRTSRAGQVRCAAELAVTDARDVAPPADAESVRGRMDRAVHALAIDGDAAAARSLLEQLISEEQDALRLAAGSEPAHAAVYATLLTLAFFLDCAGALLSADAEKQGSCASFASEVLQTRLSNEGSSTWNSFFLDGGGLSFTNTMLQAATELLGQQHALVATMTRLLGTPAKVAEPEEEWPDESAVRAARIADAQQSAPVPERVWAMRNAAATLAMTGARSQAEALLLSALSLKAEWLGSDVHASLLGELCDLHAVMEDAEAATAVAARILDVCEALADAEAAAGRPEEAARILKGAAAEYPAAAGGRAARLHARAAELGGAGPPPADLVRTLAAAHASELEVRKRTRSGGLGGA